MSRAATLPGAAARSPRAAEMDPHFTKLQPWRPRAGGTAPGERQETNLFKPVFKLNADAPAPGTTGPRTGGAAGVCLLLHWWLELAPERH